MKTSPAVEPNIKTINYIQYIPMNYRNQFINNFTTYNNLILTVYR